MQRPELFCTNELDKAVAPQPDCRVIKVGRNTNHALGANQQFWWWGCWIFFER